MDNNIYYHIDQKDITPIQALDLSLSNPLTISSDLLIDNQLLSNQYSQPGDPIGIIPPQITNYEK